MSGFALYSLTIDKMPEPRELTQEALMSGEIHLRFQRTQNDGIKQLFNDARPCQLCLPPEREERTKSQKLGGDKVYEQRPNVQSPDSRVNIFSGKPLYTGALSIYIFRTGISMPWAHEPSWFERAPLARESARQGPCGGFKWHLKRQIQG